MYKRLLDLNDFILELCYHKIAYKLILEGVKIELMNLYVDKDDKSIIKNNDTKSDNSSILNKNDDKLNNKQNMVNSTSDNIITTNNLSITEPISNVKTPSNWNCVKQR